jgi:long-chain acyl-CoA synthetase
VRNVEFAIETLITAAGSTTRRPPRTTSACRTCRCATSPSGGDEWVNAEAGVPGPLRRVDRDRPGQPREVQPTLFFAVPRIWEKIYAGIQIKMNSASPLKRSVYGFWMKVADHHRRRAGRQRGQPHHQDPGLYALGYPFLFRALRDRVGLRKVRAAGSGAAPIAPEVLKFFFGIGVIIYEIYGMTENAAIATGQPPGRVKLGTVGEPQPGHRAQDRRGDRRDPHPPPRQLRRVLEQAGQDRRDAHRGRLAAHRRRRRVGRRHPRQDRRPHQGHHHHRRRQEHLAVGDRELAEDLAVHQGGGGHRRPAPYLTALIGIELDTVGDWAQRRGSPTRPTATCPRSPRCSSWSRRSSSETNEKFARVENVRKFRMIPKELDHEDGELTATQKVKRSSLARHVRRPRRRHVRQPHRARRAVT